MTTTLAIVQSNLALCREKGNASEVLVLTREHLEEVERALLAQQWRPMSEAPNDSTKIDLWHRRLGRHVNRQYFGSTLEPAYIDPTSGSWSYAREYIGWRSTPQPPKADQ